ncbi:hypothetical protein CA13_27390 [Planctomycetes bacterium CA13]|uniref:Uncharacterized protein n=1 Tax=Novipirellula herctigrandis TaxID=2527986 RepID=A0A5C5Z1N9_9BACT|nr:hypothetical protein CA13_27390 [Planctomycetes bacterium CA13]
MERDCNVAAGAFEGDCVEQSGNDAGLFSWRERILGFVQAGQDSLEYLADSN